jgi:hypothetical protein
LDLADVAGVVVPANVELVAMLVEIGTGLEVRGDAREGGIREKIQQLDGVGIEPRGGQYVDVRAGDQGEAPRMGTANGAEWISNVDSTGACVGKT